MAPRGNDLQCPHCPKTFITEALLGMHMESKHAPGSEQKVQAGRVDAKDQSVAHLMFTREGAMNQAAKQMKNVLANESFDARKFQSMVDHGLLSHVSHGKSSTGVGKFPSSASSRGPPSRGHMSSAPPPRHSGGGGGGYGGGGRSSGGYGGGGRSSGGGPSWQNMAQHSKSTINVSETLKSAANERSAPTTPTTSSVSTPVKHDSYTSSSTSSHPVASKPAANLVFQSSSGYMTKTFLQQQQQQQEQKEPFAASLSRKPSIPPFQLTSPLKFVSGGVQGGDNNVGTQSAPPIVRTKPAQMPAQMPATAKSVRPTISTLASNPAPATTVFANIAAPETPLSSTTTTPFSSPSKIQAPPNNVNSTQAKVTYCADDEKIDADKLKAYKMFVF